MVQLNQLNSTFKFNTTGIFTGANTTKNSTERDRYSAVLGMRNGGQENAPYDPCHHQVRDAIANINLFAYALEYLGRLNNLEKWLYPQGRTKHIGSTNLNQIYGY